MKNMIKVLSILLCLCMMVTMCVVPVGAQITDSSNAVVQSPVALQSVALEPTMSPTEAPTEPATEAYVCPHWYSYWMDRDQYYEGGYSYGSVEYCPDCGETINRNISCYRDDFGEVFYSPYDSYTVREETPYTEEAIAACGGLVSEAQSIYFQAPEDWANQYNTFSGPDDSQPYMHICVYWWTGLAGSADDGWSNGKGCTWVGYQAHLIDKQNRIYRARIPADGKTTTIIWNNGVNGGMDPNAPVFKYARQLADANIEGADPGDYDTLPEGTPNPRNMDGCIQIVNQDETQTSWLSGMNLYGADWYVYYGDGCYGNYPTDSELFLGQHESCLNPDPKHDCTHEHTDTYMTDLRYEYGGYLRDVVTYCVDCGMEMNRYSNWYWSLPENCKYHGGNLNHFDTNYQYFNWGFSYDTVECCANCGDEISRKGHAVLKNDEGGVAPPSGDDGFIYFDAASAGWSGARAISFYIYEIGGDNITEWGAKNKAYTSNDGDIWRFNAGAAGVREGHEYGIIFENLDTTAQTADLLFDSSCYGDIAYVPNPDDKIENPFDSNKKSMIARWTRSGLGPIKHITSLGNVVGESIPSNTSAYQMFVNFLASKGSQSLTNALNYSGKDAQTAIDDTARALGLTQADVANAIKEAAETGVDGWSGREKTDWSHHWDASKSSLPGGGGGVTGLSSYVSFYHYLVDELPRLRMTSIKSDQYLVDDEARDRGLKKDDVIYIMKKYDVTGIEWSETKCKLDSGYSYQEGGYYLYSTDANSSYGSQHIPGYYLFTPDSLTGYLTLDLYSVDAERLDPSNAVHHVAVARYSNGRMTKVSGNLSSASPRLYFFNPENGVFGYNTNDEIPGYGNVSYGSSSSGSSSGSNYPFPSPHVTSVIPVANGLKISWSANGAAKYRVFVRDGGWKTLGDTTGTSFTYTNVKSGDAYNFTVRCISADGRSWTSDFNAAGWNGRFLDVPKVTSVENIKEGVKLKWNAVPGNAKYRVFVKYLDTWKALGDTYDTEYLHSSKGEGSIFAHSGQTYTYTVRCLSYNSKAFTSAYNETGWTNKYTPPAIYSGDADGNGVIDIADVTYVFRALAEVETPYSEDDLMCCDVNKNGYLEVMDLTAIQYHLAGMNTPFRIGDRIN